MRKLYAFSFVAGLAVSGAAYAGDCPGDCNGDGVANILDFVCFQGEWQAQSDKGDCDVNGLYNILDFVCFQGEWQDFANGGCDGKCNDTVELDDFECYDVGNVCGQGAWEPWDLNAAVCGEVSTEQANSGSQSLKVIANDGVNAFGDDTVQVYSGVDSGQWTYRAMSYIPGGSSGISYFILLNTYAHNDPNKFWSVQLILDEALGTVVSDNDGGIAAMQKDEWVEIKCHIDLDADTLDIFYGGEQIVFAKCWSCGVFGNDVGGQAALEAVDLYANEPGAGTEGVYYDDISLTPGLN
jgi:hypothetical protein